MKEEDFTPIGDDVNKQLDSAQGSNEGIQQDSDSQSPSVLRIEELIKDNTEEVSFDRSHETGFGTRFITIKGVDVEIHETHRLPQVIAVGIQPPAKHKKTQAELELLAETMSPKFRSGELGSILGHLKLEYPRLYQQMAHLVGSFYEEIDAKNETAEKFGRDSREYENVSARYRISDEEINIKDYFFSKGFDAIATIAQELDVEIEPLQLCD